MADMANTEVVFDKLIDTNTRIAVLAGGMSNEREVSLRSGNNCLNALHRLGYKNAELVDVDKNIANKLIEKQIEVAYNALHGRYGEDGCIQGLLEILGIKYTGCGVMSSALCMNKHYTKEMLKSAGIPLIKSVYIQKGDNLVEKVRELRYPMMIKPVCEGSSIGMYKVHNEAELLDKFKAAEKIQQDILIEEFVVGRCGTVGVLQNKDEIFATAVLEFRTKTEWYDFEAKYTAGMTEFILPGEFSDEMTAKLKDIAIKSHKACGCNSLSRVDFLVENDVPYVLEINTSPGMTDLSDLPAQSACIGISYDQLVQLILNSAGLQK